MFDYCGCIQVLLRINAALFRQVLARYAPGTRTGKERYQDNNQVGYVSV